LLPGSLPSIRQDRSLAEIRARANNSIATAATKPMDTRFLGAHAISQAVLFNSHPVGRNIAGERLEALMGPGGLQVGGNAQNCVAVCPKDPP